MAPVGDSNRVERCTKHGYQVPFTAHLVENYLALKALQRNVTDGRRPRVIAVNLPDQHAVNTVAIYLAGLHIAVDAAVLVERPPVPSVLFRPGPVVRQRLTELACMLDVQEELSVAHASTISLRTSDQCPQGPCP